ncbi:hypothetical protein [Hanstruepera ponticola]|uniref:hypothetical protein n=1 Tax=Hanstruepera ponticola TaxID=2042995 RepID=UPI001782E2DF|nr:hypothetical protein [Hanstruepera ponticola]
MGMIHYYNMEDGELFVFDEFLICQIAEGVNVTPEHSEILNQVIKKHFQGKDLVYISNRVNSYSVDPLTYVETERIPSLVAIAMVPDDDIMKKNAEYERNFYDKPYEIFNNLSEAIEWSHRMINDHVLN